MKSGQRIIRRLVFIEKENYQIRSFPTEFIHVNQMFISHRYDQ